MIKNPKKSFCLIVARKPLGSMILFCPIVMYAFSQKYERCYFPASFSQKYIMSKYLNAIYGPF